jgi:hypothetical protein
MIVMIPFMVPGQVLAGVDGPNTCEGYAYNGSQSNCETPMPIRAVRIQYKDYQRSRSQVAGLEKNLRAANVNLVALGAGRVEWTYFKWKRHDSALSSDVRDSGIDFLAEDSKKFGEFAQINAVIDVFAPNYIRSHPEKAAVSWLGVRSQNLVSTMELVEGDFGKLLVDMVFYIAVNYPNVDSISLTELYYHSDGYGADDKAAYMAYNRVTDWPRLSDGRINIDDPSIGNWRSYELDRFLDRLAEICHYNYKLFYMDVLLSRDNLDKETNEHGTRYDLVLEHTDRLIIWAYYDLDDYPPEYLEKVAQFLKRFDQNRVIISIGLWDDKYPTTPAEALRTAILSARKGGIYNIWITPSSLMNADHWKVLQEIWNP